MRHRTALVTAGSIAAVVVAAAIVVGANLGILNAADSHPVGKLSAATAVPTAGSRVVSISATGPTGQSQQAQPRQAQPQQYIIRKAGTVGVAATKHSVRLADVTVKHGWHWSLQQGSDTKFTVTFKKGTSTYTFVAKLGRHGTIVARVDRPVTRVEPAAPSSVAVAYSAPPAHAAAPPASASHGESGDEGGHGGGGEADD
jgi:hypothetical protein